MDPNLLAKLYPGLLEELERDTPGEEGELRIEATPSGHPTLLLEGRYVHSPRDPVREAERLTGFLCAGDRAGNDSPVVILGFGLGYAAAAAAKAAPGRPLIIVERRKKILRKALDAGNLGPLLTENRLIFVVGGNAGVTAVQNALGFFRGKPEIIRNRALMAADEAWYTAVEQGVSAYLSRDEVNQATLRRFGKRWVRNLARNMEAVRDLPGIARLEGVLAGGGPPGSLPASGSGGIPVFLAAAGPSLDEAAPFLPEIRKRCVVVAVDTSLRFLLNRGLDPDFAVVVDPQYWNFRHLDRCNAARTWLIAESAVYPPVLRGQFRGAFLCRSLFPLGCFIEDRVDPKGALGAGGSVAASAWDFARTLGAPAVWTAGLDLSFPGLKTHFKGALFENRSHAESGRLVPAETWSLRALRDGQPFFAADADGGQVLTDRRLSLYASWFASRFREYPALRNYRIVSPGSRPGIAIEGLESADPGAILELPERRAEIDSRLEKLYADIAEDFRRGAEERGRAYRAARNRLTGGLKTIMTEAAAAASLARNSLRTPPERRAECRAEQAAAEGRIVQKLDAALRSIRDSEVKEVAGFLFPSPEELKAAEESDPARAGDPFTRYLEITGRTCRALAEAAEYQLTALLKTNPATAIPNSKKMTVQPKKWSMVRDR
ncbi:MAG: DUF115 domain-containing protein [Treponema sp.]|jgi:hypothetical protein|nr:DUF115 domain-containing protein [Treponema sp.]